MLMHENEPADQQFFTVYHGQKQEEDKLKKTKKNRENKVFVGEVEVLLVLSFTLSSGNARPVTFHVSTMQHYALLAQQYLYFY